MSGFMPLAGFELNVRIAGDLGVAAGHDRPVFRDQGVVAAVPVDNRPLVGAALAVAVGDEVLLGSHEVVPERRDQIRIIGQILRRVE